nr:hypothetical protein CFP56_31377 [Quercus suber]
MYCLPPLWANAKTAEIIIGASYLAASFAAFCSVFGLLHLRVMPTACRLQCSVLPLLLHVLLAVYVAVCSLCAVQQILQMCMLNVQVMHCNEE